VDQFARRLVARDGGKVDVVTGSAEALVQGGNDNTATPADSAVEIPEADDETVHGGQRIVDDL
jgi:hypothetical protein